MPCCIVGIVSSGKVSMSHFLGANFYLHDISLCLVTINRFFKTILNNLTNLEFSLLQPSNKQTSTLPAQPNRKDCVDRRRVSERLQGITCFMLYKFCKVNPS